MGLFRRKKKKKLEDYSPEEIEEMKKKSQGALDFMAQAMKQQAYMETRPIKSDIDKCLECGSANLYKEAGVIVCKDCNRVYRIEK